MDRQPERTVGSPENNNVRALMGIKVVWATGGRVVLHGLAAELHGGDGNTGVPNPT